MISIKEYAEQRKITAQSVYQRIQRKKNKERLKDHITLINGMKYLDDVAVSILDESKNNVVVLKQASQNAETEALRQQVDTLRQTIIQLQNSVIQAKQETLEAKQEALEMKQQQLLLENKLHDQEQNEQKIAELQQDLEREVQKTWWDKLRKR